MVKSSAFYQFWKYRATKCDLHSTYTQSTCHNIYKIHRFQMLGHVYTQTMHFRPNVLRMPMEKLKNTLTQYVWNLLCVRVCVCFSLYWFACIIILNAKQQAFELYVLVVYWWLLLVTFLLLQSLIHTSSSTTNNNNTKLIAVHTESGKKHTVDKIQMKSSSRSNTYVQNVKFRLFVFFS